MGYPLIRNAHTQSHTLEPHILSASQGLNLTSSRLPVNVNLTSYQLEPASAPLLPLCFRPLKRPPPAAAAAASASPVQLLHSPKKPKIEEDEKLKMDADETKKAADEVGRSMQSDPLYLKQLRVKSLETNVTKFWD